MVYTQFHQYSSLRLYILQTLCRSASSAQATVIEWANDEMYYFSSTITIEKIRVPNLKGMINQFMCSVIFVVNLLWKKERRLLKYDAVCVPSKRFCYFREKRSHLSRYVKTTSHQICAVLFIMTGRHSIRLLTLFLNSHH